MTGKKTEKLNNAGISLIEIVVALMMVGMISAMLVLFITISRNSYKEVASEATLKEEAGYSVGFIEEIALEAYECAVLKGTQNGTEYTRAFSILAPDITMSDLSAPKSYYLFLLDRNTSAIRFYSLPEDDTVYLTKTAEGGIDLETTLTKLGTRLDEKNRLLAQYVNSMDVKVYGRGTGNYKNASLIELAIDFEYMDKTYTATRKVTARNMQ